jgi:Cu+-exporting ATPase
MLTGEPIPVEKAVGDRYGATLNRTGALVIRADKVGSGTVLAQIVQLVAQAQRSRAPMQRMADKVAYWFVLAVLATAVLRSSDGVCLDPNRPGPLPSSMPYRF